MAQFGEVYKVEDVVTGEMLAVKKVAGLPALYECMPICSPLTSRNLQIKIGNAADAQEGLNRTALREIKCLQELSHTNVLKVRICTVDPPRNDD